MSSVDRQLAEQFALTARLYAEAATNLAMLVSNGQGVSNTDLERAHKAVETARQQCEMQRLRFEVVLKQRC
jgi:hypothetical protein